MRYLPFMVNKRQTPIDAAAISYTRLQKGWTALSPLEEHFRPTLV